MKSFLSELSRRNVFRVAAAYVIVGWIVLQVGTLMFGNFGAPDWVAKVFTAVIILGFPLAILLTWATELTPDGIRTTRSGMDEAAASKFRKSDFALFVGAVALVLGTAFWSASDKSMETGLSEGGEIVEAGSVPRFSVAVLPLDNLSDESELSWVADGLSEDITTRLASMMTLQVAARNSAFAYKGTSPNIRQVGEDLNVRFVLEGSVRKMGDNLRVTAQLIEVATGSHVWSDKFDHSFSDFGHLQDNIVDLISKEIFGVIYDHEIREMSKMFPDEMSVEELAIYASEISIVRFHPAKLEQGLALALQAYDREPENAIANVVLAEFYAWSWLYGLPGSEDYRGLAEFHLRQGFEAAPYDRYVLYTYPGVLVALGRPRDCLSVIDEFTALYPDLAEAWLASLLCRLRNHHYEEALAAFAQWEKVVGTRPVGYGLAMSLLTHVYLDMGQYQKAEETARVALAFSKTEITQRNLIAALALNGKIEEAQEERKAYEALPDATDYATITRISTTINVDDQRTNAYLNGLAVAGLK